MGRIICRSFCGFTGNGCHPSSRLSGIQNPKGRDRSGSIFVETFDPVHEVACTSSRGQQYNSTLLGKVECVDLSSSNADKRVLTQRWQKPGDVTPLKNIANRKLTTQSTSVSCRIITKFTINSISLSYEFNPEWVRRIGLDVLRIQASTNDLGTFSSIKQERGLDYPFARTFNLGLGLSVSF